MIKELIKTVARGICLSVLVVNVSHASFDSIDGLNTQLASKVKMNLWSHGLDGKFQDSLAFYMDLLEAEETEQNQDVTIFKTQDLPEELLIPLMDV
jgi:hypothetical protein